MMASGFKINRIQSNDNLYLKLSGDFDGSSAAELTYTLGHYGHNRKKIIIDTASMKTIHPFGLEFFRRNNRLANRSDLIWVGKYAAEFSACDECPI
jgi:anti-anti-sigma regulatory factor